MADNGCWAEDGPLFEWWKDLQGWQGAAPGGLVKVDPRAGIRGQRAELKRAASAGEAVCGALAYHRLWRAMPAGCRDETRLVAVARVLAQVKEATGDPSFAKLLATAKAEGRPAVSELRFKRLLRIDDDWEALTDMLIRLLPLVDHRANPVALAHDIYWWQDRVRRDWANDYYRKFLEPNS